tara:strand:- start:241 stop:828 length:588 start_codon:yes stop_codon:yes gene_type:complete
MKYFVEIGTCDFDTNIQLIESGNWQGIMCEPSHYYRSNLKRIIQNTPNIENLIIEESAISDFDGELEFAEAKDTSSGSRTLGCWRRGISSVIQENHKGERLFDLGDNQEFIAETYKVPCLTLDSLIKKHKVKNIDYLKIDVEGHEMNILDAYSWSIKPSIIKMEHAHIDDIYAKTLLETLGYIVYVEHSDMYALI